MCRGMVNVDRRVTLQVVVSLTVTQNENKKAPLMSHVTSINCSCRRTGKKSVFVQKWHNVQLFFVCFSDVHLHLTLVVLSFLQNRFSYS